MHLILYGKPDCPLCDRLSDLIDPHLETMRTGGVDVTVDKRDITTDPDWSEIYRYRIPVLVCEGQVILEGKPSPEIIAKAFAEI